MNWFSDPTVVAVEDPLYGTSLNKELFMDIYRSVLELLDGKDHGGFVEYFEDYFERSIVDRGTYTFREGERDGFVTLCMENGIFPSLKEIHAGETNLEKQKRTTNPIKKVKTYTRAEKIELQIVQLEKQLQEKYTERLQNKLSTLREEYIQISR